MIDLESIQQLPERQRLTELESQIAETSLKLDDVLTSPAIPAEIAEAYGQAIGKLGKEAIALASGPTLQSAYNQLSVGVEEGTAHLEYLKTILGENAIRDFESDLSAIKYESLTFFNKYGVITESLDSSQRPIEETKEVIEDEVEQDVLPEAEESEVLAEKTSLKIRIGQGVVKFGRRGRTFKLIEAHPKQPGRDIADERIRALSILAELDGEWIRTTELKKEMELQNVSTTYWGPIKNWLLRLSYNSQPVIQREGNTKSSRYRFNPTLAPEIELLPSAPSKEIQKHIIDRSDVFIAAQHLIQFNPVLKEEFDFYIDKNLIKELEKYAPNYSHIKNSPQEIYRSREEALTRIVGLFEDDNLFMNFLSSVEQDSPEYQFVDMLFALSEGQSAILRRIMRSRLERDVIDAHTVDFWIIENETNAVVLNAKVELGNGERKKTSDSDRPQNLGAGEVVQIQHPPTSEDTAEDGEPESETEPQTEKLFEKAQKTNAQINYDLARVHVGQFIDALIAQRMSATETYDIGQIRMFVPQNMRSHYTPTKLRHLMYGDNGSKKGTPKPIDMAKLVTLYIETDSQMPVLSKKAKKTLIAEALARVRSMQ